MVDQEWISVSELARRWGVSREAIHQQIRAGKVRDRDVAMDGTSMVISMREAMRMEKIVLAQAKSRAKRLQALIRELERDPLEEGDE